MKVYFYGLMAMSLLSIQFINAEEEVDEVVITASYIDLSKSQIEGSLHVVTGEDVTNSPTQSLGEVLDNLLGVASTDYGAAVGQPVIRGMSGSGRVKVLNNGMNSADVSGIGADHINDICLNEIQQIEVVRGPASLLYSNGAIGGIVNIVDEAIPSDDIETYMRIGLESQSVNDGDAGHFSAGANLGGINFTFSAKDSQFGNYDVPKGAIIHSEDHEDHEDHEGHEEEEHEEEEHEENLGFLANSDFEQETYRFGLSKVSDWGYIGASLRSVESIYGIPYHGEEHGHEEHGHEEEHGDEDEGHEEHEGERIFSTTDSDVFDVKGSFNFEDGFIQTADFYLRDSDYSLTEQHAEEGHEEEHEDEHEDEHDSHSEGPTTFSNEAQEFGTTLTLSSLDNFEQKLAIKSISEDISILGEEAFMLPADSDEVTFGYYASTETPLGKVDLGVRYDRISRKGSVMHHEEGHEEEHEDEHEHEHEDEHEDEHEVEIDYFDRDINSTSYSFALSNDLSENLSYNFGASYLERAPTVVELFMNGAHLATGRFEVGNTTLEKEEAANYDLTLNYEDDNFFASFTFFSNDIDNYIYLQDESEEEHEEHEEDEHHAGLILANYLQKDAELNGFEWEIGSSFDFANGEMTLSAGYDYVRAEFTDGTNIPRISPRRAIYSAEYVEGDLKALVTYKDVSEQLNVAEGETPTAGYKMLDLRVTKSFDMAGDGSIDLSIFGTNLLDEKARNHSSFVKNEVPLPGRNIGAKLVYNF